MMGSNQANDMVAECEFQNSRMARLSRTIQKIGILRGSLQQSSHEISIAWDWMRGTILREPSSGQLGGAPLLDCAGTKSYGRLGATEHEDEGSSNTNLLHGMP